MFTFVERTVMERGIDQASIERVARIYKSNQDACAALGITLRSFGRLCRKYGVETPYMKKRRERGALGAAPAAAGASGAYARGVGGS